MRFYRLLLLILLFLFLLGCSHETTNNETTYYETKEEAINSFFDYEDYNQKNIMAIEKYKGNEILIFLEKGIGFAFIDQTEKGFRIFFEGPFRDFETASKEMDGNSSFIELNSVNQKKIPVIVGKIFNKDVKKVAINDTTAGTTEYIPIEQDQEYWYHFYEGESKFKEIDYVK